LLCEWSPCCKTIAFYCYRDGIHIPIPYIFLPELLQDIMVSHPDDDMYLCCLQAEGGACLIYEERPWFCRNYDCELEEMYRDAMYAV